MIEGHEGIIWRGIFLYIQPEIILEQYDIQVQQIRKGRGTFLCETNRGNLVLTPYKGTEKRAGMIQEILAMLQSRQIAVEQILRTLEGNASATDDAGNRYLLKEQVNGTECGTKSLVQMRAAAQTIGKLHLVLDMEDYRKMWTCESPLPLGDSMEKRIRELVKIRNYIKGKKNKNEFESLFWKHCDCFIKQAREASRIMQQCQENLRLQICHGELNQHNILETEHGWQIVNYESICLQPACCDLVNYLRKMLEKNNWNADIGRGIWEAYAQIRPLERDEKKALYALLLFPEKFRKVANHYMNSNKAWPCGRDLEKLQQVIVAESGKARFLEMLFAFTQG